jgi:hypothetical protein
VPAGDGVIAGSAGAWRPTAVAAELESTVPAVMMPFLTVYSIRYSCTAPPVWAARSVTITRSPVTRTMRISSLTVRT